MHVIFELYWKLHFFCKNLLTGKEKRGIIIKLSERAVHIETRKSLEKTEKELEKVLDKEASSRYNKWVALNGKAQKGLEKTWKKFLTKRSQRGIINKLSRRGARPWTLKIKQYWSLNGTLFCSAFGKSTLKNKFLKNK